MSQEKISCYRKTTYSSAEREFCYVEVIHVEDVCRFGKKSSFTENKTPNCSLQIIVGGRNLRNRQKYSHGIIENLMMATFETDKKTVVSFGIRKLRGLLIFCVLICSK